jgi:hypothetical protein
MAIIFGNTTKGALPLAHDNNGDYLVVVATSTTNDLTGMAFNGVAMTQIGSTFFSTEYSRHCSMWGLIAPAVGSKNITSTGGTSVDPAAVSISGVNQTTPYTNVQTATGTSTTPSITLTTSFTGSYVFGWNFLNNDPTTPNSGTTLRSVVAWYNSMWSSTNAVNAASGSIGMTQTGSHEWHWIAFSLDPAAEVDYNVAALNSPFEFYAAGGISSKNIAKIPGVDRVIMAWFQSTTVVNVQAFSVNTTGSPGAIAAIGTPLDIETGTAGGTSSGISLVLIDASNAAIFWPSVDSDGFARLVSISGVGNITANGSSIEYDTTNGTWPVSCLMDSTHILNVWQGTDGDGFAQIFTVNTGAGTITATGSPFEFETVDYEGSTLGGLVKLSATKAIVFYRGVDSDGWSRVLDINTGTWAVTAAGSAFEFQDTAAIAGNSTIFMADGSPMIAVNGWFNQTGVNNDVVGSFSIDTGTWAITAFGSNLTLSAGTGSATAEITIQKVDATHGIGFFRGPGATTDFGQARVFTYNSITGTLTATANIINFDDERFDWTTSCVMEQNPGMYVVAWRGSVAAALKGVMQAFQVTIPTAVALTQNLQAYWKYNESSGNAFDSSGNSNTLADTNVTYGAGKIGNCSIYDGSADYFSIADASQTGLDLTTDFSFSFWVNYTSVPVAGNNMFILSKRSGSTSGYQLRISESAGNQRYGLGLYNGSADDTLMAITTPTTGVWYHTVITWDAAAKLITLYINNSATTANNATHTSLDTNATAFVVGGPTTLAGDWLHGKLDEMGIWNRVLSPSEVTALYNSGNGLTYPFTLGPSNLKTFNTNLKANIKTINTNPIANVKSLNTNA